MGEMWARMDSRTAAEGEPFFGIGPICNPQTRHPARLFSLQRRLDRLTKSRGSFGLWMIFAKSLL